MSIEVSLPSNLENTLKKIGTKYSSAANAAARKAGFFLHSVVIKDFLSVADGTAVSRRGIRPTKRTKWPGLRRRTGTLARAVRVGIYEGKNLKILVSENSVSLRDKIIDGVAVGVGEDCHYGVLHEREGRKQGGLKGNGRNFYPFLAPAMKASEKEIQQIFEREFRNAERSK